MSSILTLKCANCGANLDVAPDMTQFACGYCGANQMVERRGGTVALKLLSDAISRVQLGTDKTASELAIRRLTEELQVVNQHGEELILETKYSSEKANKKLLWIAVISCFIGVAFSKGGGDYVALILIGIGCGIGAFLRYHDGQAIDKDLRDAQQPLQARARDLQQKIAKHKTLVDA